MNLSDYKSYFSQQRKYIDKVYWLLYGILIIVSILALFSASSTLAFSADGSTLNPILNHMIFIALGVAVAFVLQFVPSRYIRIFSYVGLAVSIVLLILTFTPLGVEINGAKRWIRIFGLTFQPSELAKLNLLLVASSLLSRIKSKEDEKKYFFIVLGITAVVCGMILIGNLSTAVLLGGIVFMLFFLARVNLKYWGTLLLVAALSLIGGYFYIENVYIKPGVKMGEGSIMERAITWCGRVDDMIVEWNTPIEEITLTDDNYQRIIAKVAVARGGTSPLGLLPGNSQERDFLPQAFADYIFAIIVEESGVIGATFLILLYLAILFRSCLISSKYADYSATLMVMGLALMLTSQALVSMMVSVGIGPVTGQPLPLISRGGTSVLITSLYFGIIMAVAREQNELHDRQQIVEIESEEDVPDLHISMD